MDAGTIESNPGTLLKIEDLTARNSSASMNGEVTAAGRIVLRGMTKG